MRDVIKINKKDYEKMLAVLRMARKKLEMWPEGSNPEFFPEIREIDGIIAGAGGAARAPGQ